MNTISPTAASLFSRLAVEPATRVAPPPEEVRADKPSLVQARLESTVEGMCPYCSASMRRTFAAGVESWVCDKDRHVAPVRNS
jgi:hypothetical protein